MSLTVENMRAELIAEADVLRVAVNATFGSSPLRDVGVRLVQLLDGVSSAVEAGHPVEQLRATIGAVNGIYRRLPETFGPRFMFDAALITQIGDEWERAGARVSRTITPRYGGGEWGIYRVQMPSDDPERIPEIRVLLFPGMDRLGDADLSDYGWVFHEMGHDGFYQVGHGFRERFGAALGARVRSLKLRGAADVGAAGRLAGERIDTLIRHWQPRPDQNDWAHEIASDVVAVWALGPAFLTCFSKLLVSQPERAARAADQHPPYLTRAAALALAAERLGWSDEAWGIAEGISSVRQQVEIDVSDLVFADEGLIASAVDSGLQSCAQLSIPVMTSGEYADIVSKSDVEAAQLTGTALIAASTIWRARLNDESYRAWQDRVLED